MKADLIEQHEFWQIGARKNDQTYSEVKKGEWWEHWHLQRLRRQWDKEISSLQVVSHFKQGRVNVEGDTTTRLFPSVIEKKKLILFHALNAEDQESAAAKTTNTAGISSIRLIQLDAKTIATNQQCRFPNSGIKSWDIPWIN